MSEKEKNKPTANSQQPTAKNLCIIPARGGSKRIPRKNIKDFLGKPIIAYSIETAIESGLFQEIMVSTDDEEIANIAQKYGAKVPFMRSAANADDHATTMDVIEEVVKEYQRGGQHHDFICCVYPTAPLMKAEHLESGYQKLKNTSVNAVFPAVAFSYPVWRGVVRRDDEKVEMLFPEHANTRSQDLSLVYHDAGQWYWLKPNALGQPMFQNATLYELSEQDVQDIDALSDWHLAEWKFKMRQGEYL
jgi:N-acylneuraminate cytidylyltransferase